MDASCAKSSAIQTGIDDAAERGPNQHDALDTGHESYHGIDTRALPMGADSVYDKKIAVLNEALIDLGMGPFQWKVFAMTGFGWFADNVRQQKVVKRTQLTLWV